MNKKKVLVTPGRYDQIQHICEFVCGGAREAGLDESAVFHIELACDEACTNIIEHAYEGEDVGDITTSYEIGDRFVIVFEDNGRPFDPQTVPLPPSLESPNAETIENLKIGGLGLHFMRRLMDDVLFQKTEQGGNRLVMIKKRPSTGGV